MAIFKYLKKSNVRPTNEQQQSRTEQASSSINSDGTSSVTYFERLIDSKNITPRWKHEARSALATMLMHHWSQVAANVRKAQCKGLGLVTRNRTHDHNGIPTDEVGFASPYTSHSTTNHTVNQASRWPIAIAAALLGASLVGAAMLLPDVIEKTKLLKKDVTVEATSEVD